MELAEKSLEQEIRDRVLDKKEFPEEEFWEYN